MSGSESEDSASTEHEKESAGDKEESAVDKEETEQVVESTSKPEKRPHEDAPEEESAESDNEWIGPMPTEAAAPAKKKKGLPIVDSGK